ncbi:hypothetical protein FEM48_Zijuj08G0194700 [Ziziphus jujuba var. spinosa]|uniref:3'(2'),5'-bisphosphate nucleotidase n=1 Tax=Ziziphus jujuba var. spinosa TaxID=714518 RepID=A0A978V0Y3_ZIZJJ|nr:hypothetical protein FEM48_Zijuj08G0194700 [Ziziphus jujuba var. spinosa]
MAINCLRVLSKIPLSTKPKSPKPHLSLPQPLSLCGRRSASLSLGVVAAVEAGISHFSSMSYDKELHAAKKAASLAATLCQAFLFLFLLNLLHNGILFFSAFGYKLESLFEQNPEFELLKVQKELLKSDIHSKSDKSPVTVADYGSQALVSFVLERELPTESFSLVAEEDSGDLRKDDAQETLQRITALINDTLASDGSYTVSSLTTEDVLRAIDSGKSEGGSSGRHWVLDPIDGTKGYTSELGLVTEIVVLFVRGDQYAIALALLDEGKVVLGVLACPNLPLTSIGSDTKHSSHNRVGCLFYSQIGSGTYMQPLDGSPPVKVHVTAVENSEEASFFESFEAAHSKHDLSSAIAKKLGVKAPPVRIDSQAKYGALSRGDGAIYLRFPHKGYREKIWDHAAGCIVVTGKAIISCFLSH